MPQKQKYFGIFHGINLDNDPISYKNRNNTTIIMCGSEGKATVLNPLIWFLQYYSQFYEDFVDEFVDFFYINLGDDYYNTYKQQKVDGNGKYNHIFKMMMKEHFVFLQQNPDSILQIFGKKDSIANLTLIASENVRINFSIPMLETESEYNKITREINRNNFKDYYDYKILTKKKREPRYFKDINSWIDDGYLMHDYLLPMALTDRRMNIIDMGMTSVYDICQHIPSNNYLIFTACRNLYQVLKTQIYTKQPSLQQVISGFQKLNIQQKIGSKKRTRRQQQQSNPKKKSKN